MQVENLWNINVNSDESPPQPVYLPKKFEKAIHVNVNLGPHRELTIRTSSCAKLAEVEIKSTSDFSLYLYNHKSLHISTLSGQISEIRSFCSFKIDRLNVSVPSCQSPHQLITRAFKYCGEVFLDIHDENTKVLFIEELPEKSLTIRTSKTEELFVITMQSCVFNVECADPIVLNKRYGKFMKEDGNEITVTIKKVDNCRTSSFVVDLSPIIDLEDIDIIRDQHERMSRARKELNQDCFGLDWFIRNANDVLEFELENDSVYDSEILNSEISNPELQLVRKRKELEKESEDTICKRLRFDLVDLMRTCNMEVESIVCPENLAQ
jgi:hypothetical protein